MAQKYCRVKPLIFEDYVRRIAGKASQRMYVVKKNVASKFKAISFHDVQRFCSFPLDVLSTCFAHEHMYHRQEITKESF